MFSYHINKAFAATIMLSTATMLSAQNKNELLDRKFWQSKPSLELVKQKVEQGNDPTASDDHQFDAISMAFSSKASNEILFYLLSFEGNHAKKKTHDGRPYLFLAAATGNLEVMEYLLNNGADIKHVDDKGATALIYAASSGQKNLKVYDMLINAGANVKTEMARSGANVLLLMAPHFQHLDESDYFIRKGLSLNAVDDKGYNFFHYASKSGNIEYLEQVINAGIDPKVIAKDGGNAFMMATQGGRGASQVRLEGYKYLEKLGINPNIVTTTGQTPLHNVARSGDKDVIHYFLEKGLDVNKPNDKGETPFMVAATGQKNLEIFEHFLKLAKDLNRKNKHGQTALHLAVMSNSVDICKAIIAEGGSVDAKDNDGNNLSYYLVRYTKTIKEYQEKLDLLRAFGFKHNQLQENKNTPLHIAIRYEKHELIKSLLEDGSIDINAVNGDGFTVLHMEAQSAENDEFLRILLDLGADKSIKSEFGETAFDLASENELLNENKVDYSFLK